MDNPKVLYVTNRKDWRAWLEKIMIEKKRSGWYIQKNPQENRVFYIMMQ